MRILETESYEKMSALAAGIIGAQILLKPDCVLVGESSKLPLFYEYPFVRSCEYP